MGSLFGSKKPKIDSTDRLADQSFGQTVNQFGPGFETSFGRDAAGNKFQRFSETGDQARLTQQRGDIAKRLGGVAGNLIGNLDGGQEAYEKATFDRALALLSPQLERQERNVRNTLVNTGNPIGSERASYELDDLSRRRASLLNDTALGAVQAGLQNRNSDLGQVGNIFSIMQADRPQYFQSGQLISPELAFNRSAGQANLKQKRQFGQDALFGSILDAGARVGSAGVGGG